MSDIAQITEWPDYATNPQGGDPITQDLTSPYNKGDLCWMLVCTILCWLITPAIGFLYSGMQRRKGSMTMILQSYICACLCGIQFWVYGFSLYQSRTTNPILGDLSLAGFHNVLAAPSMANADIPDIMYATFGVTFVTCTAMILAGAMLERGRLGPSIVFILCWTTFVYYILAYWEWNASGWLYNLGLYDFAGSGPVHIASGFGALAWSLMLGRRVPESTDASVTSTARKHRLPHHKPNNPFLMCLGTVLIWFGWFAFNGASTANLSLRSIYVVANTNLAACGGGVAWVGLEYLLSRKITLTGFCSGIISGLVGITPAAGFVPVYTSCLIGFLTSIVCFFAVRYKYLLGVDDGLDIFSIHGVGGYIGDLLTGIFAAQFVPALDGVSGAAFEGGWWNRNFRQLGLQFAGATVCASWSFVISCILLFVINKIPGLHLRVSEEEEIRGIDYLYLGDLEWDGEAASGGVLMTDGVRPLRDSASEGETGEKKRE